MQEQLSQGILWDPYGFALPYTWAHTIVEEFDLIAVPKAPVWLLGVTNVQGSILPVVDLSAYFSPNHTPAQMPTQQRLLVGGAAQGGESGDMLTFAFHGLPMQLRYERQALGSADIEVPDLLREVCLGHTTDARGQKFYEIDPHQLTAALMAVL